MDRQIPTQFEVQIIDSPLSIISNEQQNINRLKAAVFSKYRNRNGSYISDEVADQLIETATSGNVPVVGFFDQETKTWASHTGPTLANAYGYVESFLGWEPRTDSDGESRDYAIFSVILFTDYFDEAKNIIGQNQSMELDINSIEGTWVELDNEFYFVYSRAKMAGFCVIGNHEPCFSASSFFSKQEETQKDKIAELLFSLRKEVEKFEQGGEQSMDENMIQEQELEQETDTTPVEFSADEQSESVEETEVPQEEIVNFEEAPTDEVEATPDETPVDWQAQFNELQANFEQLNNELESTKRSLQELLEEKNALEVVVNQYKLQEAAQIAEQKASLIAQYKKIIDEEEISVIEGESNDLSYEELESKLAVAFARKQIPAQEEEVKIPLPAPEESQFALLMKKYRKN